MSPTGPAYRQGAVLSRAPRARAGPPSDSPSSAHGAAAGSKPVLRMPLYFTAALIIVSAMIGVVCSVFYHVQTTQALMRLAQHIDRVPALRALTSVLYSLDLPGLPFGTLLKRLVDSQHPASAEFPLMAPGPALGAVLVYVFGSYGLFAVVRGCGSGLPRALLLVPAALHNVLMIALSTYMFVEVIIAGVVVAGYSALHDTSAFKPVELRLSWVLWVFYASKVPEWSDTVLMLLRNKTEQFTYLHWYHHASVYLFWWVIVLVHPFGNCFQSTLANSLVHMVMYSYYLLRLFGHNPWWKFWVTYLQLFQFVVLFLVSVAGIMIDDQPTIMHKTMLGYMTSMVLLFSNFLFKSKRREKHGTATHTKAA